MRAWELGCVYLLLCSSIQRVYSHMYVCRCTHAAGLMLILPIIAMIIDKSTAIRNVLGS